MPTLTMELLAEVFAAATPAIAIFCLTLFSISAKGRAQHRFYEDADGQSTKISVAEYQRGLRFPTFLTQLAVLIGLVVSIATAFRITFTGQEDQMVLFSTWLRVSSWVRLNIVPKYRCQELTAGPEVPDISPEFFAFWAAAEDIQAWPYFGDICSGTAVEHWSRDHRTSFAF